MKIVIAGAGKVGFTVAQRLCREGHDITLIDTRRELLESASNAMDVMGVCGSCAAPSILREAEIDGADVFIAATGNDEANLVSSQFARKMGAKHTVVRLREQDYMDDLEALQRYMGLSLIINPDFVTAQEISRALQFPTATQNPEEQHAGRRYAVRPAEAPEAEGTDLRCRAGRQRPHPRRQLRPAGGGQHLRDRAAQGSAQLL